MFDLVPVNRDDPKAPKTAQKKVLLKDSNMLNWTYDFILKVKRIIMVRYSPLTPTVVRSPSGIKTRKVTFLATLNVLPENS